MVQDGWVMRDKNNKRPVLRLNHDGSRVVRRSRDEAAVLEKMANPPKIVDRLAPE
jgi:hypothetical protein